jgi:hypothetical protein
MFSVLDKNARQQITLKKRIVVVAEQLESSLDTNIRKRTTGKEAALIVNLRKPEKLKEISIIF